MDQKLIIRSDGGRTLNDTPTAMTIITASAHVCARPGSESGRTRTQHSFLKSEPPPAPPQGESLSPHRQSQAPQQASPPSLRARQGALWRSHTQSCSSPEGSVPTGRPGFAPVPKRCAPSKGTSQKKCWCMPSPDTFSSNYTSLQVPSEKIMWANSSSHPEKRRHHKGPSQDADLNV